MTSPSGPCGRLAADYQHLNSPPESVSREERCLASDPGTVAGVQGPRPGAVATMAVSGAR